MPERVGSCWMSSIIFFTNVSVATERSPFAIKFLSLPDFVFSDALSSIMPEFSVKQKTYCSERPPQQVFAQLNSDYHHLL